MPLSRRRFLQLSGAGWLAAQTGLAIEPFSRPGTARFQLSLAAYSFLEFFQDQKSPEKPKGTLDLFGFIDYCAAQGCAGAELTSYFFPKEPTNEYLIKLRRHAFLRGVSISGTAVGNQFTLPAGTARDEQIASVKTWIDRAAVLGTSHLRVFAGNAPKDVAAEEAAKLCIAALEECGEHAGRHGIFLGLENHGGIVATADELLKIIRAVKSPWVGVNLDSGNFHGADPYAEFAQCAPYAVNVQVKPLIQRAGAAGSEPTDCGKVVQILREANYQGWVALEYEAPGDPWEKVPPLLNRLGGLLRAEPPAVALGQRLFNGRTLAGWKAPNFGGQGELVVEEGAIILGQGGDLTGINYTGPLPQTNYEVVLEARRLEGSDFFCGLTFPVGEDFCTLVVGGWGGSLVGISSINGEDASENETMQTRKFEQGRWYKIRLRVTPDRIQTWIDDESLINLDLQGKKLGMRHGEIELSQPFGFATYRTRAALREIQLRKL